MLAIALVSVLSLLAGGPAAADLVAGGWLTPLSYSGAEMVVPRHNGMGRAKWALETSVK